MDREQLSQLIAHLILQHDRAAAITLAAGVDQDLEILLRKFFVDEPNVVDKLMKGLAPLATFAARIESAYALGLISESERRNLNLIRKIRNDFAHQANLEVSFETPGIKERCLELEAPTKVSKNIYPLDTPGGRYKAACAFMIFALIIRYEQTSRRETPEAITIETVQAFLESAEGT